MDRRKFIQKGIVAGSLLLGGAVLGCSTDLRGQLRKTDLTQEPVAGIGFDDYQILHYASLAPSSHNSQPWFVRVEGQRDWVVGVDPGRRLPEVDPDNREAILSIGAFLENLVLAAEYYGYKTDLDIMAHPGPDLVRVRLVPGKSNNNSLAPLSLRRTLKTGMLPREIEGRDIQALQIAAGGGLHYFPRNSVHARCMAEAAVENFRRQFENRAAMAEAARWTRLSHREAVRSRDGLTTEGMEIKGIAGWVVRHFMGPEDVQARVWREKAVEKTAIQAGEGGGWMVITSRGNGVLDLIDAGRRFQRLALMARGKNIAVHPMTQTLEEGHGRDSIRDNHAPSMVPQFMLRVGYVDTYPDPVSLRRPVNWFVST